MRIVPKDRDRAPRIELKGLIPRDLHQFGRLGHLVTPERQVENTQRYDISSSVSHKI